MHGVFNLQLCGTFMYVGIRVDIPKGCFADPLGAATSFQGIRGYISVMSTLKIISFFKLKE
jgi:hypothetical protein